MMAQFKNRFNFSFCWSKNSVIWLREQEDSRPVKIKDTSDLEKLANQQQDHD